MRVRFPILLCMALVISVLVFAQESPEKGPATGDRTANSTTPLTYQGCVIRSNGKIMLADAKNQDYILVSSGRSLDGYVGQEVKLSAINMNPSDPSSDQHGMSAEQPQGQPMTLDVEDIQKVSDKCTSPQTTEKK
jgi:hypothetical protein